MNLKYLEYSLKIAESHSINKAASELLLSQSYLSSCLKTLENEIGFPIFLRTTNGIIPTQKGGEFLFIARDIINKTEKIKYLAKDRNEKPLNIASGPLSYIMKLFLDFKTESAQKFQDVLIEYISQSTLIEAIAKGKHCLGITLLDTETMNEQRSLLKSQYKLQVHKLLPVSPCYVVISKAHPLYNKEKISLDDLHIYPIVCYPVDDMLQFQKYLKRFGLSYTSENLLIISNRGQFFDALSTGNYYALMSYWNYPPQTDLRYIPLAHTGFGFSLNYICPEDYHLSPREKLFLDYIVNHMS